MKRVRVRIRQRNFINIAAFDLGSSFAWATNVGDGNVNSIVFGGIRPHRLGELMKFLQTNFDWDNLDAVVYETPFARGYHATRSLWGIAGVIEACASAAGLPVTDVAVATIKKFAVGDGHASKRQMIEAAQRMGYKGSNEHEADAFCLLRYAEANMERVA